MQLRIQKVFSLGPTLLCLLSVTNIVWAQEDSTVKKRLRSPAVVKAFIGGESHDSYVIHGRQGRKMTVQISWRRETDNRAEFTISLSHSFFESEPVTFGRKYAHGTRWTGEIPKTADYYIYVVGHPTAHYVLRVTVK